MMAVEENTARQRRRKQMGASGKVLSIGLGDLVSARNAGLRMAGFDVVAALSIDEVFRLCEASMFDLAIVGHAFSFAERAEFVRCSRGECMLSISFFDEGHVMACLQEDYRVPVTAPTADLVGAI